MEDMLCPFVTFLWFLYLFEQWVVGCMGQWFLFSLLNYLSCYHLRSFFLSVRFMGDGFHLTFYFAISHLLSKPSVAIHSDFETRFWLDIKLFSSTKFMKVSIAVSLIHICKCVYSCVRLSVPHPLPFFSNYCVTI